ncbi:HD domain-containing protein [bacterium]|nr:HD domain-containing protein [bacterium]
MDFKEIKSFNINNQPAKKKKAKEQKNVAGNNQEIITQKDSAPTNPNYWQNTIGIKHSPSFKGVNFDRTNFVPDEPVDDAFMKRIRDDIHSHFENTFFSYIKKEEQEQDCLNIAESIAPYGKKVLAKYVDLLNKADGRNDRFVPIANMLITYSPEYNSDLNDTFANFFNKTMYTSTEEYEQIKNHFGELLTDDNSSNDITPEIINYARFMSNVKYGMEFNRFFEMSNLTSNTPCEIDAEYINALSGVFNQMYYIQDESYEKIKSHYETVLSNNEISDDNKFAWLAFQVGNKPISYAKGYDIDFEYNNKIKTFDSFMSYFPKAKDKEMLINLDLSNELMLALKNLFTTQELKPDTLLNYARIINENPYRTCQDGRQEVSETINSIIQDKDKLKVFNFFINRSNSVSSNKSKDLNNIISKQDTNICLELIDKLSSQKDKGACLIDNLHKFINLMELLDENNKEDFYPYLSFKNALSAYEFAKTYQNPVTNKFDINILNTELEFADKYNEPSIAYEMAKLSIDAATGEISPLATDLLDIIYFQETPIKKKLISIAGKILPKQKNRVEMANKFRSTVPDIIKSLKDKDGNFNETNFKYIKKLLFQTTSNYSGYYYINEYIDTIKDENGIIDENIFNDTNKILKKVKNYKKASSVCQLLNRYPKEKRNNIFNTIIELDTKSNSILNSMEGIINFCFDENGDIRDDRYDFMLEIINAVSKQNKIYGVVDEFFEMSALNEDNRKFVKELIYNNNNKSEISLSSLAFIFKAFKTEENTFPQNIKDLIRKYLSHNLCLEDFIGIYNACIIKDEEEEEDIPAKFNEKMFEQTLIFEELYKNVSPFPIPISEDLVVKVATNTLNAAKLNFKSKVEILSVLQKVENYITENNIKGFEHINKMITDIDSNLNSEYSSNPITKEARNNFISNVLNVNISPNGITPFEEVITKSIPTLENMEKGLPLKFSRKEFLEELSAICQNNPKAIDIIQNKTNITLITENEDEDIEITGYDGLILLDNLNQNNETEKAIYDCMHEFLYNNSVNTGNKELDTQLNHVIKAFPEFVNTIGKVQHGTHKYTLDIHQLLVLAYSMDNPNYKNLKSQDKNLIKLAGLFHDIMKKEGVIDKGHQNISAMYARNIVKKVLRNPDYIDRIYDIINNHHWLEEYSTNGNTDEVNSEFAFKFRRPNDFEVAKIMANSDLKAVSPKFYEDHKSALNDTTFNNIENKLKEFYANGNALFSDYIVSPSKLENHKQIKDGKEYNVINMNKIPDYADMAEYGFHHIRKNDLRFLVHMVDDKNIYKDLNTTKMLASPINGGVLSESLITPEYTRTYCNRRYGLLLSQINTNIVNEAKRNQGSGYAKDFSKLLDLIFGSFSASIDRSNFRKGLLDELSKKTDLNPDNISNEDFAEFYKNVLASKTSIKEINPEKDFNIGEYTIKGKDLISAIKNYQDSLIHKNEDEHNEIVGYIPKIQAVIAKETDFSDLPDELLNFAFENKLPIIMI